MKYTLFIFLTIYLASITVLAAKAYMVI